MVSRDGVGRYGARRNIPRRMVPIATGIVKFAEDLHGLAENEPDCYDSPCLIDRIQARGICSADGLFGTWITGTYHGEAAPKTQKSQPRRPTGEQQSP